MAPSECPIIDLMELMAVWYAWSPRLRLNAPVSWRSFIFVPEPCALT